VVYISDVLEILKSATYESWFNGLRDRQAQSRINARVRASPSAILAM
jgi:putative component of toxin-antitoxin plasmid stabilization module